MYIYIYIRVYICMMYMPRSVAALCRQVFRSGIRFAGVFQNETNQSGRTLPFGVWATRVARAALLFPLAVLRCQ